jgi:hypothetical protein
MGPGREGWSRCEKSDFDLARKSRFRQNRRPRRVVSSADSGDKISPKHLENTPIPSEGMEMTVSRKSFPRKDFA